MPKNQVNISESRIHFGKTVKRLRKEKNLTQKELAKKIGVSYITIQAYENATYPRCENLIELSNVLNTTPNDLLGYPPNCHDIISLLEMLEDKTLKDLIKLHLSLPKKQRASLLIIATEFAKK